MNDFLKKVIKGNGITPPEICLNGLNQNFENAINVDWFDNGKYFEAQFYKDSLEHIALFSPTGALIEYKLTLPEGYLPETFKTQMELKGELMNCVLINKGNTIEYEIILRDSNHQRYLFTLSDMGKILSEKKL